MNTNMVGLGLRDRESTEQLREALVGELNTGERRFPGRSYFVDDENGSDANTGLSPDRAFKTIQKGLDVARYKPGTSVIDYDCKSQDAWVFVAPGHYNESILFSGYNIHLIGLGPAIPGKDYGVSVNYDGAVDTTAVVAFSGSGNHIANLHIYCAEAIPALWCAGGDNNLIENCVIECDGTNCTYGIHMDSMKGSRIKDCVIRTPATAGIYVAGGADHYAIDGGIENCQVYCAANAVGILIDNTNVVYNFKVDRNHVSINGATGKGIDNNATGAILITDNYVDTNGGTPIESAGGAILGNHTFDGTTTVDPNLAAG